MLSRNLVKQAYVVAPPEEKRVIDNNALVRKRIGQLTPGGFVSGLGAEVLDVSAEEGAGNVIKAGEDAEMILEEARKEAEAILNDARLSSLQMRDDMRAETELEKNRILAQARQQGYDEGTAQARAEVQAIEQEYQKKAQQLEAAYQQQIDVLEPQFVDTITGIYEHIFHVELGAYRDILVHLISNTIRKLEGSHDFMIHVSKGAVSANCSVDVVEDTALQKNQCMIETENGIYDCGLDTQMTELKRRLQLLSWTKV